MRKKCPNCGGMSDVFEGELCWNCADHETPTECDMANQIAGLRTELAQSQERVKELEVCESELDRLDTYLHDPGDDDGTVTATVKVMEQWCADLRKALDRIKELEAVVLEVFSLKLDHGDPKLDIIGSTINPWSKETRLTVINTLREAAKATQAKEGN